MRGMVECTPINVLQLFFWPMTPYHHCPTLWSPTSIQQPAICLLIAKQRPTMSYIQPSIEPLYTTVNLWLDMIKTFECLLYDWWYAYMPQYLSGGSRIYWWGGHNWHMQSVHTNFWPCPQKVLNHVPRSLVNRPLNVFGNWELALFCEVGFVYCH